MYTNMSTSGLLMIHEAIARSLKSDLENDTKSDPYYGVRETSDWSAHRDQIEMQLKEREVSFTPLTW